MSYPPIPASFGSRRGAAEAQCKPLDALEGTLPNVAEAAVIALVGGARGASKAATGLSSDQWDQKVELMRARCRSLLLDTTLSRAQMARVDRVSRTLERIAVVSLAAVHLDRLSRLLENEAGRDWAGVLLRMARSALLQLGIQTVQAIESRDMAEARAVTKMLEKIDEALREAIPSNVTDFLQDPVQRRLSRGALLALYAARDCLGLIADDYASELDVYDPADPSAAASIKSAKPDDLLLPLPPPRARRILY